MFEKRVFDLALRRISRGGVAIRYWDGDTRAYGPAEPYVTVTIKDPSAARAMLRNLTLGFGEAYTDGRVEVDGPLDGVGRLAAENEGAFGWVSSARRVLDGLRTGRGSTKAHIAHHYDRGNEFYALWLDASLTYSCAYFLEPDDPLETAQVNKLDHILRKLRLREGQRLLDIGSGWGALLITAAREYGVHGLGVTLSEEQLEGSRRAAKAAGVDDRVTFELCDFRDLAARGERFDRVVSVGMFEHVGRTNHERYYDAVAQMLAPGGVSVLHTITSEVEEPTDAWIDRYIFPGGYIPSTRSVVSALPRHGLRLIDFENLRRHYAMTLDEWRHRYQKHRAEVIAMFDERFYRMWDLWLAGSAAAFRYGSYNLAQFVMTKGLDDALPLTRIA
jgi:cyclopropane-fatty-acyl-phospholipid synthase